MGKVAEGGQYEVWADGVANSSTRLTRFHLRFPFVAWIGPKLKVKYRNLGYKSTLRIYTAYIFRGTR